MSPRTFGGFDIGVMRRELVTGMCGAMMLLPTSWSVKEMFVSNHSFLEANTAIAWSVACLLGVPSEGTPRRAVTKAANV